MNKQFQAWRILKRTMIKRGNKIKRGRERNSKQQYQKLTKIKKRHNGEERIVS